ncbi:MAG: hypothetical protein JXB17_08490, partial [Bacteroidales bacterium]|nr:hypothetical protein [Bacteroidales bacterium]
MKKNLFLAFLFCTFLINSVNAQSTISITAPNGGEILTAGQTYNITWMSTGIETIQIAYSLNAGASWTPIASSANATTGAYSWTVPDIVSSTVIIGVIDNLNLLNNDASNAPFSIIAATQTPVLNTDVDTVDFGTITAGGKGNVKTFTLSGSNLNEDVTLTNSFDSKYDLSVDGGGSYYTSTTIPYNLVSENNRLVYVRFTGQENDGLTYFDSLRITSGDAEDKYVFLKAQTIFDAEPSIIVTSPNGGEQFAVGSQQNITWTSAGISTVDIYYVINGFINNLIETNVTASSGTFSWTVPNENSSNVQIKVVSSTNSAINDLSDERFTIAPATKSIQVTSPNGGEQWTVGSQHTITWITTGIDVSQELEVRLSRDGGLNYYILTDGS